VRRRLADRSDIAPRRDVPFHRRGHTREQSTACETSGGGLIRRVIPAPRRWCRLSFAFRGFRNDGILPVICPTSQIVVVESRRRATAKPTAKLLCMGLFSRFGVRGPRRPWLPDRNSRPRTPCPGQLRRRLRCRRWVGAGCCHVWRDADQGNPRSRRDAARPPVAPHTGPHPQIDGNPAPFVNCLLTIHRAKIAG